jgi:hypothetical protein
VICEQPVGTMQWRGILFAPPLIFFCSRQFWRWQNLCLRNGRLKRLKVAEQDLDDASSLLTQYRQIAKDLESTHPSPANERGG